MSLYNAYNSDDYLTEIFLIDNNIYEVAYATLASSLYSYKHLSVIILNMSSIICYRVNDQQLSHGLSMIDTVNSLIPKDCCIGDETAGLISRKALS